MQFDRMLETKKNVHFLNDTQRKRWMAIVQQMLEASQKDTRASGAASRRRRRRSQRPAGRRRSAGDARAGGEGEGEQGRPWRRTSRAEGQLLTAR